MTCCFPRLVALGFLAFATSGCVPASADSALECLDQCDNFANWDEAILKASDYDLELLSSLLRGIPSTATIVDELGAANALPDIAFLDELDAAAMEEAGLNASDVFAVFIPAGLAGNSMPLIALHRDTPLVLAAMAATHELQHAADTQTAWYAIMMDELEALQSISFEQAGTLQGIEAEEQRLGLREIGTYIIEYQAFSAGAAVARDLTRSYPWFPEYWSGFKESRGLGIDLDPRNIVEDADRLADLYIWVGNWNRVCSSFDGLPKFWESMSRFFSANVAIEVLRARCLD